MKFVKFFCSAIMPIPNSIPIAEPASTVTFTTSAGASNGAVVVAVIVPILVGVFGILLVMVIYRHRRKKCMFKCWSSCGLMHTHFFRERFTCGTGQLVCYSLWLNLCNL